MESNHALSLRSVDARGAEPRRVPGSFPTQHNQLANGVRDSLIARGIAPPTYMPPNTPTQHEHSLPAYRPRESLPQNTNSSTTTI